MATPAKVVLSIDDKAANATLDKLYARMSNAPGINLGGGGGIGSTALGVGLGIGGFKAAQWMANGLGVTQTADALRDAAFLQVAGEGAVGKVSSAVSSRDAIASRYGLLYELGMVDKDFLQRAYDIEEKYGAGAAARGSSKVRGMFGVDVAGAFAEASMSAAEHVVKGLFEMGEALGNKIADLAGLPKAR